MSGMLHWIYLGANKILQPVPKERNILKSHVMDDVYGFNFLNLVFER